MNDYPNSKSVLFVMCLAASLVPFMSSALNLAMPFIISDYSMNASIAGWVPSSYMLATAIFQIPCAKIADMVGRRKIFMLGAFIFMISSLLCSFASSATAFLLYRSVTGIGSAMIFGTSMALLTAAVPPQKRGMALGINTSVVYFSLAAGPLLGGLLTQELGWEYIFYTAALISIIVVMGILFLLKDEWKEKEKQPFDYIGSLLYAVSLFFIIYGFSKLPELYAVILLGTGIIILLAFVSYENKQRFPVFNMKIFLGNRVFKLSSFSALINYAATSGIAFMLSLYLQYIRELTPRDAGFILITQSVVQGVVSLFSGRLSDKISATFLATTGMSVIFVGLVCLCFLTETTSFIFIIAILMLLGLGFGIFSSPNTNIIMSSVDKKNYGMASATTGTMRQTGQALSMGIVMMAISLFVGNRQITPESHGGLMSSMNVTFIVFALLCLIGIYTSSVRNKN